MYFVTDLHLLVIKMTIEEVEENLLVISYKDDDKKNADKAFSNLYWEYSRYLGKVIGNALKGMGIYDEDLFETVKNNTFITVYKKPLSFSSKGAKNDKGFKGWLATIAKNELKQLLEEYFQKDNELTPEIKESMIESMDVPTELQQSINHKTLNDAMANLSERDRHILRTLYLYYEEGRKTPSEVLDMLCKLYDTTRANIRQIKSRSEKKIIKYFAKRTSLKPLKK